MRCIAHQLNTAMKACFKLCETDPRLRRINQDLTHVKTLVRIFKQSGWNKELGDGNHLIQEVDTRFGTTFAVTEPFMRSGTAAFAIVDKHDSVTALGAK